MAGDDLGRFDAYAVGSATGPHVTLQAGVLHLGRHWTTVSRRSVKARSVQRRAWASAAAASPGGRRIVAGPARVLDGLRPWTVLADPVATALAGGAVMRLGAAHPDQLLGYAEGVRAVPGAFAPWGRALLVLDTSDELLVEGDRVVRARGRWSRPGPPPAPAPGRRRARSGTPALDRLPDAAATLVGVDGPCWLGVDDARGAVAVPARWDAAAGTVTVAAEILAAISPALPGRACVTFDDSRERRPDRKRGVMLRGGAAAVDSDGSRVEIGVTTERVTLWDGFRTATVAVPPPAATAGAARDRARRPG